MSAHDLDIICDKQAIAMKGHRHDATHLNTGENYSDVAPETHLATQNNNALELKLTKNKIIAIIWEQIQQKIVSKMQKLLIPSALTRHVTYHIKDS